MGKQHYKPSPRALAVQEDLGKFLEFCRDHGYRFNAGDVYNFKSYAWQQYNKFVQGKNVKNMWVEDARRLGRFV
jgi:hypothetical protein